MSEEEDSLDAFITSNTPQNQPDNKQKNSKTENLEDEFAKLLNDFINQENTDNKEVSKETENKVQNTIVTDSLDNFQKKIEQNGLENFITTSKNPEKQTENLDNFITAPNKGPTAAPDINQVQPEEKKSIAEEDELKSEERELARAIGNFQDGIYALADKKNIKAPETDYNPKMLLPNYKPSIGKKIAQYLLSCWDFINQYDPENMKRLSKNAGDEEYLAFAETLNDTDMQLTIISYVEILINMEICEVSYAQKKEIIQKNRIKRELYEEYIELQRRKEIFIKKLKEKKFPIDVDKLIGNYFKAASKDADGSFKALTKNPAMFSPIEIDKIRPKFFGLIKVTPEDGIKANQKIGNFIKKLKV